MLILSYLALYAPIIALIIAAPIARALQKRSTVTLARGMRIAFVAGSAAALLALVLGPHFLTFAAALTQDEWVTRLTFNDSQFQFALPLAVGVMAVGATLLTPKSRGGGPTSANLARRSLISFSRRSTLIWITALGALAVLAALVAGPTATQDDRGRSRMIMFDSGYGSAGTETYGWYYSAPALGALLLLLVVTGLALHRIAEPPLQLDAERDVGARRVASELIGLQVIAALLFHLAQILRMFNSVGSISGTFSGPDLGAETQLQFWSPLAALSPGLLIISLAVSAAGGLIWGLVFWRAVFARSSADATQSESRAV